MIMTNKEALKRLNKICIKNRMHLVASSFTRNAFAFAIPSNKSTGNCVMENGMLLHRISDYHKPQSLILWFDGYLSGKN